MRGLPNADEPQRSSLPLAAAMDFGRAREAAAAAARANPLTPKRMEPSEVAKVGKGGAAAIEAHVLDGAAAAAPPIRPVAAASLASCGWYFEDASDEVVKVTVPLEAACAGAPLPKEGCVRCMFGEYGFTLEAALGDTTHRLDVGELLYRILPKQSVAKVRPKAKKVVLELRKGEQGKSWAALTAF